MIDTTKTLCPHRSSHPSPFSAFNGFGCHHFPNKRVIRASEKTLLIGRFQNKQQTPLTHVHGTIYRFSTLKHFEYEFQRQNGRDLDEAFLVLKPFTNKKNCLGLFLPCRTKTLCERANIVELLFKENPSRYCRKKRSKSCKTIARGSRGMKYRVF